MTIKDGIGNGGREICNIGKKGVKGKTLFISTYQKEKGTVGREGRGVDWLRSMRGTDTKADRARQRVPQPIMAPGSLSPGACKNPVFL